LHTECEAKILAHKVRMGADPKHAHYDDMHIPGEEFWGIGIENELYLETLGGVSMKLEDVLGKHRRERYSVDYWRQYKQDEVKMVLGEWGRKLQAEGIVKIRLPLLINAHSLTRCDLLHEHRTLYTRIAEPNPKFGGKTVIDELRQINPPVFGPEQKWWTFDGDSIEITTQAYYRATVEDVVAELIHRKKTWIQALNNALSQLGDDTKHLCFQQQIVWMRKNYGFAVFATNPQNVAIFNNGTYHINLTAPTRLDKNCEIEDRDAFVRIHRNAARLFQWISPLLVARFGSPDPLACMGTRQSHRFPAGSQRIAASRYIGLGTYDTRIMETGKLVTRETGLVDKKWWDSMYRSPNCAYAALEKIGFDINFQKFRNHGLELRIFDWFPVSLLPDLVRLLVWMLSRAVEMRDVPCPQESAQWNAVTERAVWHGTDALVTAAELDAFRHTLDIPSLYPDASGTLGIVSAYERLFAGWADRYDESELTRKMTRKRLFRPQPLRALTRMDEEVPTNACRGFRNRIRIHGSIAGMRRAPASASQTKVASEPPTKVASASPTKSTSASQTKVASASPTKVASASPTKTASASPTKSTSASQTKSTSASQTKVASASPTKPASFI
jgi:hypothetical protein